MDNSDPLVPFGIGIIVIIGLFIAIPFLRRKSDILTGWNCLLLGLIIFAGLGSIEVKYVPGFAYDQLKWFQPSAAEVTWYMQATAAFIVALLAAFYLNGPAKRFAQRRLQKWPDNNALVSLFAIGFCWAIVVASFLASHVTFVGPVLFNLGQKGAVFSCVFSFLLWYRNRINVTWLLLFLGVLMTTLVYAMLVSPGRRLVLSVFFGPILCIYWLNARYWRPMRLAFAMGVAVVLLMGVTTVYSKFRWYSVTGGQGRTVSGVVSQLKDVRVKGDFFGVLLRNKLDYLAQSNAHFALLTERYVALGLMPPIPLNTLRFLVAFPIPRKIWKEKPETAGIVIVRDVSHIPGTNWGLGVAGQGAYEGGIPALILYAVLLALFIRIIDEPIKLQPDNPFLIAIQAAALPHIVGIPRGDMAIMFVESADCVLFAFVLGIACRLMFGTAQRPVPTGTLNPQWPNGTSPAYRLAR
ncbi:MAG TPA: hypothetical protein VHU84_13120 [Lacipirellulaceae bacterium]|jgi:hypothetical protein|nr:hypothetical protein [Lacipirellulaceae bacterium]